MSDSHIVLLCLYLCGPTLENKILRQRHSSHNDFEFGLKLGHSFFQSGNYNVFVVVMDAVAGEIHAAVEGVFSVDDNKFVVHDGAWVVLYIGTVIMNFISARKVEKTTR